MRNFDASSRKAANSTAKFSVSQHSNSDARRILVNHVEEARKNMGVGHPDSSPFDRAVKEFILAYREGVLVAGVPGKARRADSRRSFRYMRRCRVIVTLRIK